MPKQIKRSKKNEKKNSAENKIDEVSLEKQIGKFAEGLIYISETDSEIFPFTGRKVSEVSKEELLKQIDKPKTSKVEERDFEDFFQQMIMIRDWFEGEEINNAGNFSGLKKLLEDNLRDLKVFKVGTIQIDIYVVGIDKENNLAGIWTKAVET